MNLKQAREALGWSQARLAEESGINQQQISRLERKPTDRIWLDEARQILDTFKAAGLQGLTLDALFPAIVKADAAMARRVAGARS